MSPIYHTYYIWTNKDNKWNATILCFFILSFKKKVASNIPLGIYFQDRIFHEIEKNVSC